jgi:hypothetical protein
MIPGVRHIERAVAWAARLSDAQPLLDFGQVSHSGPLRYAIVDGLNVRDSRVHNYPPRWNAAPSQERSRRLRLSESEHQATERCLAEFISCLTSTGVRAR